MTERGNFTVLVDQDSVIADFEGEFLRRWRDTYPDHPYIPLAERKKFYISEDYPSEYKQLVEDIHNSEGFLASLPPIEGAIDALSAMREEGFDVRICTSPLTRSRYSLMEKYDWVM